jgi:hypothetical protein
MTPCLQNIGHISKMATSPCNLKAPDFDSCLITVELTFKLDKIDSTACFFNVLTCSQINGC